MQFYNILEMAFLWKLTNIMYVFMFVCAYMYVMLLILMSFSVEGQVSRSIRCMSGGSGMPQSFTLRG